MVKPKNKKTLKGDSRLYHNLLDCDPSPQTYSLPYMWQIAPNTVGEAATVAGLLLPVPT